MEVHEGTSHGEANPLNSLSKHPKNPKITMSEYVAHDLLQEVAKGYQIELAHVKATERGTKKLREQIKNINSETLAKISKECAELAHVAIDTGGMIGATDLLTNTTQNIVSFIDLELMGREEE